MLRSDCYRAGVIASPNLLPAVAARRARWQRIQRGCSSRVGAPRLASGYRAACREEKLRILDELVAVTGYHRKHSIRVLNSVAAATANGYELRDCAATTRRWREVLIERLHLDFTTRNPLVMQRKPSDVFTPRNPEVNESMYVARPQLRRL